MVGAGVFRWNRFHSPIRATYPAHRLLTGMYCAWDDRFQRKVTFLVNVLDPHSWSSWFNYRTGDLSYRLQALFSSLSLSLSVGANAEIMSQITRGGGKKVTWPPTTNHFWYRTVCMLGDHSSQQFYDYDDDDYDSVLFSSVQFSSLLLLMCWHNRRKANRRDRAGMK